MDSRPVLTLRAATVDDAALLASIHSASWRTTYRGILSDDYLAADVIVERATHWEARMSAPGAELRYVAIAELDREPVGFVCVEQQPESLWGVLLDNLHALPGYQGLGAGKLMVRAAAQWAKQRGSDQLYLFVIEDNTAAIRFYESQGWRYSGSEQHELGGTPVSTRRYVLPLDAMP